MAKLKDYEREALMRKALQEFREGRESAIVWPVEKKSLYQRLLNWARYEEV